MKRVFFLLFCVFAIICWSGSSFATQVEPVGVYWDLQVSYGSGSDVGDGTLDSDNYTNWNLSIPHAYTISNINSIPNSLEKEHDPFYVNALFDGSYSFLYAYTEGELLFDYYSNNTDWYRSLSKFALASNIFSGFSEFTISFDWETNFTFFGNYSNGYTYYGIGIYDWTLNQYISTIFSDNFTNDSSGHYENSWIINPTHQYLFVVTVGALIEGTENPSDPYNFEGGSVEIEITNLNAQAVPEPASMLLVGAGLGALALFGRRKKA